MQWLIDKIIQKKKNTDTSSYKYIYLDQNALNIF